MSCKSTLAERAMGTAFSVLYEAREVPPPRELTPREKAVERNRVAARERQRAKRAEQSKDRHSLHSLSKTAAMRESNQFARWKI